MRKWMLCAVALLMLSVLACEVSVDIGSETPEPTTPPPVLETPSGAQLPTPLPFTPTPRPTDTPPLPTETPAPGFGPLSFATEVNAATKECIAPVTVFSAGVTKVYACFEYWGMWEGREYSSQWYRDGREILSDTFEVEGSRGTVNNSIFYTSGRTLDSGTYEVRYYIAGQLVQSGTFIIQ